MANSLEESIRFYMQQGYTKQQIVDYLISFGYPPKDVNVAFAFVESNPIPEAAEETPEEKIRGQQAPPKYGEKPRSISTHKNVFIIAGILIIIILAGFGVAAYWFMTLPECGNGVVEKGETAQTCCEDVGCIGDQDCSQHACVEPTCGYCEYLEDHYCKSQECCASKDCADDAYCENNFCIELDCLECQYYLNHQCNDYPCCVDTDCGANFRCVSHECLSDCGECQYMVNNECFDHECCDNDACAQDEICEQNNCVPAICDIGEIVKSHECWPAERCNSDADCDDNFSETLDLCIGAKTSTSHCTHLEADQCTTDSECDDDDITTNDRCVGSPQHCVFELKDCDEFGVRCLNSEGVCDSNMTVADDTAYCCLGTCEQIIDLYIDDMDEDDGIVEVEVAGMNRVNANDTFKIYAFENNTRMKTLNGLNYAEINGKNDTDTFYFNMTIYNKMINITAVVDYDDEIEEINETNNNRTITATLVP